MKKTRIILVTILFIAFSESFCQSEINKLTFSDYNSKSFEFIEYSKDNGEFEDLKTWYEGKIDDRLWKTLKELNQITTKYPDGIEITVIPFGNIPEKNNPLHIIYKIVDPKTDNELSILFSYLDDKDLIIDNLQAVKLTDLLKDSLKNPPPEPPRNNKNK